jgi:hypothetical protein
MCIVNFLFKRNKFFLFLYFILFIFTNIGEHDFFHINNRFLFKSSCSGVGEIPIVYLLFIFFSYSIDCLSPLP